MAEQALGLDGCADGTSEVRLLGAQSGRDGPREITQDKPLHSEGRNMVRLKFVVSEKTTRLHWDKSKGTLGTCKLLPVSGGSDENKAFYEATPSGSVEFGTINQAALDALPLGAEVYISIEVAA